MLEDLVIASLRQIRLSLERAERRENVMRKEELIEGIRSPQSRQAKENLSLESSSGRHSRR